MIRDSRGIPLEEGDLVAVTSGNEMVMGQVAKLNEGNIVRGLSLDANSAKAEVNQPFVVIQSAIVRPVQNMNGNLLANGVLKLYAIPEPEK